MSTFRAIPMLLVCISVLAVVSWAIVSTASHSLW